MRRKEGKQREREGERGTGRESKRKRRRRKKRKKKKKLKIGGIICKEDMKEKGGRRGGQKRKIRAQHKQLNKAASTFKLPLSSRK